MTDKPLLLENPQLVKRIAALFAELDGEPALQATFINSPGEVLGGEAVVRVEQGSAEESCAVGQFIFSVLANEGLQQWLEDYRRDVDKRDGRAEQRLQELARAFVEYGGLKLADDGMSSLEDDIVFVSSISRTYLKTLNNRVTFVTRIKVDDPPQIADRRMTSMHVVSMAEQLLDHANSARAPAERTP